MTRTFTLLLALLLVAIAVPVLVVAQRVGGAQTTDNGPFGALRWRSVGPPRGGRSLAVTGSVARQNEYYSCCSG